MALQIRDEQLSALARELWEAETSLTPIAPLRDREPPVTPHEAYRIQLSVARLREALGHRIVGKKVGLTSKAMQEMAGLAEPDYGHLFDVMRVENGTVIPANTLIAPKIEPEIAFVLEQPLRGPDTTASDVLRATAYVVPVLEVVDSRVTDWNIRWVDTVADNGSSARFVVGDGRFDPRAVDFESLGVVLERNGEEISTSTMAAVMENPVNAVAWLANKLAEWDITLGAGEIVLPGSPCRAVDLRPGDTVRATMSGMGTVSVSLA